MLGPARLDAAILDVDLEDADCYELAGRLVSLAWH